MKPPIFPSQTVGETPQHYLHRARMFRNAAAQLPDYVNGEVNWPRYALLTHAIELALKAFVWQSISTGKPPTKGPGNHDLTGWYKLALQYGLEDDPTIAENVDILSELHFNHYSRYPKNRSVPLPAVETIIDTTVDHLIDTFTQTVNPR